MSVQTKTFPAPTPVVVPAARVYFRPLELSEAYQRYFLWFQLIVAYLFLEYALWSNRLAVRNKWAFIATITIIVFVLLDRPSIHRLGLALPTTFGASTVLAISFAAALCLALGAHVLGGQIPANPTWPTLRLSWEYLAWALIQEFLLQSFFFVRCEELFGSRPAVWITATLFAAAHLPSPILTTFTLIGGLFFCETFRRYRSIYPIGVVHALLGLTIAATMPATLLHDMRVGIGFLRY